MDSGTKKRCGKSSGAGRDRGAGKETEKHRYSISINIAPRASERGDAAKILAESISPEVACTVPGSRIKLSSGRGCITIEISAEDVGALRAAANSCLKWLCCASDVLEDAARGAPQAAPGGKKRQQPNRRAFNHNSQKTNEE